MESLLTTSNVTFVLGVLAIVFTVYNYFKNPQIKSDKVEALMAERMRSISESTDRRFKEMQESFQSLLLQSNNHIHTVDTKVEGLTKSVSEMSNTLVRLGTIIEERIPKKL